MSFFNKQSGYTLLELLIVVSILGVLSTVTIFSNMAWKNKKQLASSVIEFKSAIKNQRVNAININKITKIIYSNKNSGIEIELYEETYPTGLSSCENNTWVKLSKTNSPEKILVNNNGKVLVLTCSNNNCINIKSEICFYPSGASSHKTVEFYIQNNTKYKKKIELYSVTGYLEESTYNNGVWKID